jgi:SHS2 domain-containing protein
MGIRGWGGTCAEAFEEIAAAMFELTVDGAGLAVSSRIEVRRAARDSTELLVEFLNGLISGADVAGIVLLRAVVGRLEKQGRKWIIEAIGEGVPVRDAGGRLLVEVKAATYYGASVKEERPGAWTTRCVVDL